MGNATSKAAAGAARRQFPSSASVLNSASSTSNAPSYQAPSAPSAAPNPQPSSRAHPEPRNPAPSGTKSSHIELDGRDPQFASSLRKLGPAVPVDQVNSSNTQSFPTSTQPPLGQQAQNIFPPSSSTSTTAPSSNSSLKIVQARERISQRFAQENEDMGRASFKGRSLISAKEISDVIRFKAQGRSEEEIERQLRLNPGVVRELIGWRGVIDNV